MRLAVLANVLQHYLPVHLDDRLNRPVAVDGVHVVCSLPSSSRWKNTRSPSASHSTCQRAFRGHRRRSTARACRPRRRGRGVRCARSRRSSRPLRCRQGMPSDAPASAAQRVPRPASGSVGRDRVGLSTDVRRLRRCSSLGRLSAHTRTADNPARSQPRNPSRVGLSGSISFVPRDTPTPLWCPPAQADHHEQVDGAIAPASPRGVFEFGLRTRGRRPGLGGDLPVVRTSPGRMTPKPCTDSSVTIPSVATSTTRSLRRPAAS